MRLFTIFWLTRTSYILTYLLTYLHLRRCSELVSESSQTLRQFVKIFDSSGASREREKCRVTFSRLMVNPTDRNASFQVVRWLRTLTLAFTRHKRQNHTWHLSPASDLEDLIPTRSYRQRLGKLAFICVSPRRTTTTSLNLWFLRVIGVYLLLTFLPLNHALRWREWREWSPTTEALDFWTNSPAST